MPGAVTDAKTMNGAPVAEIPSEVQAITEFVNTLDVEAGRDELDSPQTLAEWLTGRGLLEGGGRATSRDLELARKLREALRAVLRAHHDVTVDREAISALNEVAARLPLSVRFDPEGDPNVVSGGAGVVGALGRILSDIGQARITGSWHRLKICSMDSCQWAFYDRSKNRSGRWCSMGVCGNRAKTRTYRSRRRSE